MAQLYSKKGKKSIIRTLILILFVFSLTNNSSGENTHNKVPDLKLELDYTYHDPIHISSNNDLTQTASIEGWQGNGGKGNPIVISGYSFSTTNNSERLIEIANTDLYFRIENCLFQGGYYGILLQNVTNGNISTNTFSGTTDLTDPITIKYSSSVSISNNTITDRQNGIRLLYCNKSVLRGNDIDNINTYAIYLYQSNDSFILTNDVNDTHSGGVIAVLTQNNSIEGNYLRNYDTAKGIILSSSTNFTIVNNDISSMNVGGDDGIYLSYSSDCFIKNNSIASSDHGIYLVNSESIRIANNTIHDNGQSQVYLESTNDSIITNNSIYNNVVSADGIVLAAGSSDNFIVENVIRNIDTKPIFIDDAHNSTILSNSIFDSYYGISISKASYLSFRDNYLYNLENYGVYADHISNSMILNNFFLGQSIYFTYIENTLISQNIIDPPDTAKSITLKNCQTSNITKNSLHGGIDLIYNCSNVIINQNRIDKSNFGIRILYYSSYITTGIIIEANTVINSSEIGISIEHSSYNKIINNTLINNSIGIFIEDTGENNWIENNTITENRDDGIYLGYHCNNNEIKSNNITKNQQFGIEIYNAGNNKITWNNFVSNNGGNVSQAQDDYSYLYGDNFYDFNYWDSWNSPDENNDGIVDFGYNIPGSSKSIDSHPLSRPMRPEHFLTDPKITFPNNGETIRGNITITWSSSIDSLEHNISYNLLYQPINSSEWIVLVENISTTTYFFNSWLLHDGSYNIKVVAYCTNNLSSFDQTDTPFLVENHLLSQPTILNPTQGETLTGMYAINWYQSSDTFNHSVTYSLLYSTDLENWNTVVDFWDSTTYVWNTTSIPNGNYWIKVVAYCSEDLTNSSTVSITVKNIVHNLTRPYIINQTCVGEIVVIEWLTSIDSLNHSVVYNVFYFKDGENESLNVVITNISSTSICWNTSVLTLGTYYIVVIATCTEGLTASAISGPIKIDNETITSTQVTSAKTNSTSTTTTTVTTISIPTNISKSSGWEILVSFLSLAVIVTKKNKRY